MENILISLIGVLGSVVVALISNHGVKQKVNEVGEEVKYLGKKSETAFRDIMKRDITDLYYKRKEEEFLYQFERESLDAEYEGYKEVHGNTFIDDLYKEMRDWEVRR